MTKTIDVGARERVARALLDQWPDAQGEDITTPSRYLLVEDNVRGSDPSEWYSTWATISEALAYHVHQEYASDWSILGVYDLDNGGQPTQWEAIARAEQSALDRIEAALNDRKTNTHEALDTIADIVRATGRTITRGRAS